MGYDIADHAASLGAEVTLVSGPTHLSPAQASVNLIRVESAEQMFESCHTYFPDSDVAIAAAAVADYKPKIVADQKIKKSDQAFTIELETTQDILASLGAIKTRQFLVGFALETENEIDNAIAKIRKKNLDLIVLNSLNDAGAGFGHPTNKVTFIDSSLTIEPMELKSKEEVAADIINKIITHFNA
jgi:phosphopantothenoylcysteine decarboxylase/phosphopantothenate--cysteine ligase